MIAANTIAQLGAPVLRLIASTITDIHSPETQALIEAMQTTLAGTSGVGLAAPQIGVSKRLLIVASRPTARYPNAPLMPPTIMINPCYTALSPHQAKDWEG
ncbi:MAG: peptide deformylase, partial [Methylococcaceae bacterium]|nr:peptide deformylase [Methylococcaceae bacterium]